MKTTPTSSPGWARMQARLSPEGAEALRQDTLRRQQEALAGIREEKAKGTVHLSRDGAKPTKATDYPKPKRRKK